MAEQVLMVKDGEQMNVPGARVDEFLEAGWVIVKRAAMVIPADLSVTNLPEPEAKPKVIKPKAGSK